MKITRDTITTEAGTFTDVIVDVKINTKFKHGSASYIGEITASPKDCNRFSYPVFFASSRGLREMLSNLKAASC